MRGGEPGFWLKRRRKHYGKPPNSNWISENEATALSLFVCRLLSHVAVSQDLQMKGWLLDAGDHVRSVCFDVNDWS